MLWLAGLMGIMSVGAFAFADPQSAADEDEEFAEPSLTPETTGPLPAADASDLETAFIPEDPFVADYDPRGGDDAAILPAYVLSEGDQVTLTEGEETDDVLEGTDGNDRIRGLEGDDALTGRAGNDELRGEEGDDTLGGDAGSDTLHGHDGDDDMRGGSEDDALFGHNSDDTLYGDDGNDALQGSAGHDSLDGGTGDDTLQGGLDDDTLTGGMGADALFGGWGSDVLNGIMRDVGGKDIDSGDFLNGGGGDDSILAGAGDIITGGDGADQIVLGEWIGDGAAAQIMDFMVDDDSLVLVWDDSEADSVEPTISLSIDSDTPAHTLVFMDGTMVAMVNGTDLIADDIALISLSAATQAGLAVN